MEGQRHWPLWWRDVETQSHSQHEACIQGDRGSLSISEISEMS